MKTCFQPVPSLAPQKRGQSGFTLVEMVISLGIVGFAFTTIVGILPFGLQNFRAAMDTTLQAQMAQSLVSQANQSSYSDLSLLSGQSYYFDDNGNLVGASSPSRTYHATLDVTNQTVLPSDETYSNSNLARVTITFVQEGSSGSQRPVGTFVTYIASKAGGIEP